MAATIPPLANLCSRCQVIEFDDSAWPGAHKAGSEIEGHYLEVPENADSTDDQLDLDYELLDSLPNLPLLSENAENGCEFCSVLKQAIQKCTRAHSQMVRVHLSYMWYWFGHLVGAPNGLKSLVAEVGWIRHGKIEERSYLRFDIDAPSGPCAQWLRLGTPPRDEALCPENLQMIVGNLKKNTHEMVYFEGNMYPARLIEIGEKGDLSCRLVETHSHPEFAGPSMVQYAALSYCWGPQEDAALQFKTEQSSLESRLRGFGIDEVTPILRDAIRITRAVKIPYLWVDAVCIIQDDKEDWDRESSRMILVYWNAALTISTPASTSCQQGVLARDWMMTSIKFQSKIDRAISGSYNIRFCSEERSPRYASCDSLTFALQYSPWADRGWTLQEYELSYQILVFARNRLHILTDNGIQSEGSDFTNDSFYIRLAYRLPIWNCHWYLLWLLIVEDYSGRKLSDPSDKLPAISGLAKHTLPSTSPNYYAGHIYFHIDLFWTPRRDRLDPSWTKKALVYSLEFQDSYTAPSWSWVSRSYTVQFGDWSFFHDLPEGISWHRIKEECQVTVSVALAGSDQFGKIKDGSLLIRGAVVPIPSKLQLLGEVYRNDKRWQMCENSEYVAYLSFDWDEFNDDESFENLSLVLLGSCKARANTPWRPIDGIHEAESYGGLEDNETYVYYMIEVAESGEKAKVTGPHPMAEGERHAYGIIIHPASVPGKYLRVGVFYSVPVEAGGLKYFQKCPTQTVEII